MSKIEIEVKCPYCGSNEIVNHGKNEQNKQRYLCKNKICKHQTFLLDYSDKGRKPEIKNLILKMSINGSGIRDISRVLEISPTTVIETIKQAEQIIKNVNINLLEKNEKKV